MEKKIKNNKPKILWKTVYGKNDSIHFVYPKPIKFTNYDRWTCYGVWAIVVLLFAGFLLNAFTVGMAVNVAKRVEVKNVRK